MSALSTPGGGGTTAQNKPASGKPKFQKLDINSLYCANKNENSEPSSVKSQLSRKHGMQSLGKVPSARRPPANLPSLKTETGQDPNANSVAAPTTTVTTPATCTSQTTTTPMSIVASAALGPGGWSALPPPSSPHFRTEFPSLEAAAQPSHRATEHSTSQPQLRPQTEGSWTCGGGVSRPDAAASPVAAPASAPAQQPTPVYRAILPPFLMKGSSGGGLGLAPPLPLPEPRAGGGAGGGGPGSGSSRPRPAPAPAPTPRAVEVLTARPILRDDQISSLDDMSRDAGWAQHDDIDYDQKLDFSDGESSAPSKASNKNNNRPNADHERVDPKIQDPGDEEQIWAERRQKQNNEVAQAVARARLRKEEEQRRQLRDSTAPPKDPRDRVDRDRDRNDNRDQDIREKDRMDNRDRERTDNRDRERTDNRDRERTDNRDRDRMDSRDKRSDLRDRDKDRVERDRNDNRDRFDNRDRDRDRDVRDRDRGDRLDNRDRGRGDNRDRQDNDKERSDGRDRDRNDNRDRTDRDRFDRERERPNDRDRDRDRDRVDRDRPDRERERDFRERDRDYGRDREPANPAFSKTFQANIPPRFLKQQQNRQQDDQHKGWAFAGKQPQRRQEPAPYNAPRHTPHNGARRSYSRDYSDREDDFRREKDGSGPQWRSEMQDYDRPRELDRSNSKDSYKDYDYKDRRDEPQRKLSENSIEHSSRTAADKLTEVFERKSIGLAEPFASSDSSVQTAAPERRNSPPSNLSQRGSSEREFGKTSWAEVTQEDHPPAYNVMKSPAEKLTQSKDNDSHVKEQRDSEKESDKRPTQSVLPIQSGFQPNTPSETSAQTQATKISGQNFGHNQQQSQSNSHGNVSHHVPSQIQPSFSDQSIPKTTNQSHPKVVSQSDHPTPLNQKQPVPEQIPQSKNVFITQKSEKEFSESESIASKSSTDPSGFSSNKIVDTYSGESIQTGNDVQKRSDEKRSERFSNEQMIRIPGKEPVERKSSGSGSEKKGRGYGGSGGGYAVYVSRGWGTRESRGRRSHRNSRSNNRASESDGSTDGAPNSERKERRRAPRSPRGPKKQDRPDDANRVPVGQGVPEADGMENREPFAPRGQPSRRGRGGFQGTTRPPAPAKRVAGYGPPNTKSPFSQTNRAAKENEEGKEPTDDKNKAGNKPRTGSSTGRGRDRRPKGGPNSGEDENWETTSEHSEGGGTGNRRRSVGGRQAGQAQKSQGGRNQTSGNRQNNSRTAQAIKKDNAADNKPSDISEAMSDLKLSTAKKDDEIVDDGFQEVRNKKTSKDARGPTKEEGPKQGRSHSIQGGGRNGSSSRNPNEKQNARGSAPVPGKSGPQYDRPRQVNLAPRFVKQRQKQQMGLAPGFGPDTGAAPPPPPVNAWDKPISQTLRGNVEENVEVTENKSTQSSQRSSPGEPAEAKILPTPCAISSDKSGVLDGTTPPVETIIFENTNYKTAPPAEALKPKYQPNISTAKPQIEEVSDVDTRPLAFNGQQRTRSIQELMGDNARPVTDADGSLGLPIQFDTSQKTEDSSDMKLDFAFDSDLGHLTEDKSAKSLGLPRATHMSTSSTISPLAADLNLKIASVKKVWEMPAVAEGSEEMPFTGFEESNTETGAPPNVCKVKPTQQLQSPPPQHYNHVGYQGGYGGLSVPSPPAVLFNSSQQLLGSSQQMPQQGSLYGAFLDQSRSQFGGFPGTPYGAGSAGPYNYQPPPDMFQSLPSQYRMAAAAAAGGGAAFGQTGQLGNSPSTVLISSSSNSLMSATVKPSSQQIGAIGSKGVGGVGVGVGVGGVNTYGQQYLGYSGPVGEQYSLQGLMPRPPAASSYYSPYQPPAAPQPSYPLQYTPPAQNTAFNSQFLSSQLQVAAAVQQMQQQYRAPMQQQFAPRPPPQQQQLKSPLHDANGYSGLCEAASPTPKGPPKQKPPHSPPHHKYHAPPPQPHQPHQPLQPPPSLTPHHQHQQHHQQMVSGLGGRCSVGVGGGGQTGGGGGGGLQRGGAPRYPAPIQRPHAPALPMYRAPPAPRPPQHHRHNMYYHHHHRNGGGGGGGGGGGAGSGGGERAAEAACEAEAAPAQSAEPAPAPQEVKAE